MAKLNQVIAIEKGVKSRVYSKVTQLHKESQKAALYEGFRKEFTPVDEEGERQPNQEKKVTLRADKVLTEVQNTLSELLDVTAQKDFANCNARADVEVNGMVLVKDAPVTYLLFLEKQLTDVRTFVSKLPTLPENYDWTKNQALGLYATAPVETRSTKKVQKPIVLYPATPEHPAQTQLVTEDVTVGNWTTVGYSGAMTVDDRDKIISRVDTLLKAVKFAREQANSVDAPKQEVGEAVFNYLFG